MNSLKLPILYRLRSLPQFGKNGPDHTGPILGEEGLNESVEMTRFNKNLIQTEVSTKTLSKPLVSVAQFLRRSHKLHGAGH